MTRRKNYSRDARETHHSSPITHHPVQPGRRRFMVGAAGLTFGVAIGLPDVLTSGGGAAFAQVPKGVVINPYVTLHTDGTVIIMSPAAEMGQGFPQTHEECPYAR